MSQHYVLLDKDGRMDITQLGEQIEGLLEANGGSCPLDLLFLAFPDASQVMVRLTIAKLCNDGKAVASGSLLQLAGVSVEESPSLEQADSEEHEAPIEAEELDEGEELIGQDSEPMKTYELLSDEEADEFIAEVRRKHMHHGLEHLSDEPIIGTELPEPVIEDDTPAPTKELNGVFSWDNVGILPLSTRPSRALENAKIGRIGELLAKLDSIDQYPNCGARSVSEIETALGSAASAIDVELSKPQILALMSISGSSRFVFDANGVLCKAPAIVAGDDEASASSSEDDAVNLANIGIPALVAKRFASFGINTIGDVREAGRDYLLTLKGIGVGKVNALYEAIERLQPGSILSGGAGPSLPWSPTAFESFLGNYPQEVLSVIDETCALRKEAGYPVNRDSFAVFYADAAQKALERSDGDLAAAAVSLYDIVESGEAIQDTCPEEAIDGNDRVERKPVHPTTDRTWRNTEYDLTKVPLEAARIFYRTRLEVSASGPAVEPWQAMLEVFLGWVGFKELRRLQRGSESLMEYIPPQEGLMESQFVCGGFHHACLESYLRTEAAFLNDGDEHPQHWALEYVERDGAYGYRFWVTEIGISDIGSGCWAVNARIRYYDDPTYIYEVSSPERNAPRFVKDLILKQGLLVKCGGLPLRTSAAVLTKDNFDIFLEQLIDEERTAPLVVVSRNEAATEGEDPSYPVDPRELARLLAGVAVVYALDRGDPDLEQSYSYIFDNPDKPAYKYRLVPGCLRIFWGGVDLDSPTEYDYARHRFFTSEALESMGTNAIIQNISAGVSRMFSLRAGEVLGIGSVGYQASLMRTRKLEQNRLVLSERLREAEARHSALEDELEGTVGDQGQFEAYQGQIDLLTELLETADAEIKELQERQGQSSGGVMDGEYQLQAQDLERARYDLLAAEDRALGLERDNGHLRYRVDQLEQSIRDERTRAEGSEARSQLLFEVGRELRDPVKVVEIAKKAFADRLVILDRAVESAHEFKGEPGEMFDGLAAIYLHLWPLRFGEEGDAIINEDEFQARSGFGLAFHESKQTKRNSRLAKQRVVEYRGKTYDISPHVKGGDKKRGHLRIHFFIDSDERMIVIGHCGNHMETDGTAKM